MEKFVYNLDPTIAQDVITSTQFPQTYGKALRVEVFIKKIYGQTLA